MNLNIFQKELDAIKELEQTVNLKNKSANELVGVLEDKLEEQQFKTIQQISQLDKEFDEMINQIDCLEGKYAELDGLIINHQQILNGMSQSVQNIDSYMQIIEVRRENAKKINECMQLKK